MKFQFCFLSETKYYCFQTWRAKFRATQQQRTRLIDSEQDLDISSSYPDQETDSSIFNLKNSADARDGRSVGLHSVATGVEAQSIIKIDEFTGNSLLRASLSADKVSVQNIMARERRWRTRVSILQSQGKTFYENIVFGILRNVIVS